MGVIEQLQNDIANLTSNTTGFGVAILFEDRAAKQETVNGMHTKHHINVNPDTGVAVNGKKASVAVSEQLLVAAGFTVRNSKNEVDLTDWKATVKDSSGNTPQYIIRQWFPDETLGLIVCILGDFE